jgi:hypothetical protein
MALLPETRGGPNSVHYKGEPTKKGRAGMWPHMAFVSLAGFAGTDQVPASPK